LESLVVNQNFWLDRPVFVTGGTGLVGSWLVKRLLAAKAQVICLVRDWVPRREILQSDLLSQITIIRGDICDQALMERILGEYEVPTVIHLAAQTIVGIASSNPISTFETNIRGTWTLLDACRHSPKVKQVVCASSDKAYGSHEKLPYDENSALDGIYPYDMSKSCSDLISRTYAKVFKVPTITTRCGNFYGGGDFNWNRIVPGTIRSVVRNQAPVIRSDGKFIRDYFYVEDGANVYMELAEKLASNPELSGEAFNFSNEIQVDVLELVDRILKLMGSNLKPEVRNEASYEIRHQYLSAEKARKMLNWSPLFDLDEGLNRTIEWYKEYFERDQSR
jgi:CDP-glucose 4,6-dehydratase